MTALMIGIHSFNGTCRMVSYSRLPVPSPIDDTTDACPQSVAIDVVHTWLGERSGSLPIDPSSIFAHLKIIKKIPFKEHSNWQLSERFFLRLFHFFFQPVTQVALTSCVS